MEDCRSQVSLPNTATVQIASIPNDIHGRKAPSGLLRDNELKGEDCVLSFLWHELFGEKTSRPLRESRRGSIAQCAMHVARNNSQVADVIQYPHQTSEYRCELIDKLH